MQSKTSLNPIVQRIAAALLLCSGVTHAADKAKLLDPQPKAEVELELSAEKEASALAFAREHHSELAELVENLRSRHPAHFNKAVRELSRTQERLEKLHEARSQQRYENELAIWKLDSRIRLLSARSAMKESPPDTEQLQELLRQRYDLRTAFQQQERDRLAERVKVLDTQIAESSSQRDAVVAKEFERMTKVAKSKKNGNAKEM